MTVVGIIYHLLALACIYKHGSPESNSNITCSAQFGHPSENAEATSDHGIIKEVMVHLGAIEKAIADKRYIKEAMVHHQGYYKGGHGTPQVPYRRLLS